MKKQTSLYDKYMWDSPGEGIFDIEKCKSIANNTTFISSDNQIVFPSAEQYQRLVSFNDTTVEKFNYYSNLVSKEEGCTVYEAQGEFLDNLRKRAHYGFYGESIYQVLINRIQGLKFIPSKRDVDSTVKIDGLLKSSQLKKYLSIKSDYFLFVDDKKVKKERSSLNSSNLDATYMHVFYNLRARVPYLVTENYDYLYLKDFKFIIEEAEEFFLEKILRY